MIQTAMPAERDKQIYYKANGLLSVYLQIRVDVNNGTQHSWLVERSGSA
ncbi:MAG: hypothetical protein AAF990_16350 [Bacteroidota bacterium]